MNENKSPIVENPKGQRSTSAVQNDDPWAVSVVADTQSPRWNLLSRKGKWKRVAIGIFKSVSLVGLLYLFVCSLDLLSLGFRLLGGRTTGELFRNNVFLQNSIVGLMVGILTTVLLQSSSSSTSIVVSMVAADFLTVKTAIPIIMGANIGTTTTNTIVCFTQARDRNQFRRSFAGATVHDMFNWMTAIVLLIVEETTNYLYHLTNAIMDSLIIDDNSTLSSGETDILGAITKPFVNNIVQLDKKVLECWAQKNCTKHDNSSLLKKTCGDNKNNKGNHGTISKMVTNENNFTNSSAFSSHDNPSSTCTRQFLISSLNLNDRESSVILIISALIILCACLILIVKILNSTLKGRLAVMIQKTLNFKIPYFPWLTGYLEIVLGAGMTFLVQSSSVFTSALVPLIGIGVLSLENAYPLTLGSNMGTTTTALLASMAVEGKSIKSSIQVALCHFFFNLTGVVLFYPIPFMRLPIRMAKFFGNTTAEYRWFAIVYLVVMFILLPLIVLGLSYVGSAAVIVFVVFVAIVVGCVTFVNIVKTWRPALLPKVIRTWDWLPVWFRSLEPYDNLFTTFACCRKLQDKNQDTASVSTSAIATKSNVTSPSREMLGLHAVDANADLNNKPTIN